MQKDKRREKRRDGLFQAGHWTQKHFLKTIWGPCSSYSSWLIHDEPTEVRLASAAPPLHTEKTRSWGLLTRTTFPESEGTRLPTSAWSRSGSPGSSVFPPAGRQSQCQSYIDLFLFIHF